MRPANQPVMEPVIVTGASNKPFWRSSGAWLAAFAFTFAFLGDMRPARHDTTAPVRRAGSELTLPPDTVRAAPLPPRQEATATTISVTAETPQADLLRIPGAPMFDPVSGKVVSTLGIGGERGLSFMRSDAPYMGPHREPGTSLSGGPGS
ncbi:MAG: hypothetical protein GC131_07950 [Alphaproteobacteria bacterium]|nr:hypothetical protein [Alphaproteobacteria bacterium]